MHHASAAGIRTGDPRTRRLTPLELVLLATVCLAFAAAVLASAAGPHPADLPTTTLRVQQGDTMWEIASAHPVSGLTTDQTVALIAEMNGLGEGKLVTGSTVVVPSPRGSSSLAMR